MDRWECTTQRSFHFGRSGCSEMRIVNVLAGDDHFSDPLPVPAERAHGVPITHDRVVRSGNLADSAARMQIQSDQACHEDADKHQIENRHGGLPFERIGAIKRNSSSHGCEQIVGSGFVARTERTPAIVTPANPDFNPYSDRGSRLLSRQRKPIREP